LLEALFSLQFLTGWLLTPRDIAPIIGIVVFVLIVVVIIVVIVKWSYYWTKKGFEEYAREHPEAEHPQE